MPKQHPGEDTAKPFLSESAARRCEEAKLPTCKCRCGGVHHGRSASAVATLGEPLPFDYYNKELSPDDPHWLPTEEQKKQRVAERKRLKRVENRITQMFRWHYVSYNCEFKAGQRTESEEYTHIPCTRCGRTERVSKE